MQINLLLPAAYSYLCHAEFPSGQTTFRQIGPTRFQFDRPSLPTNRTTSTHYGIPLPPRRTRSHTGRSQLPHRRIGGAGRTFPCTGFPDRTDDRSRRHLDARTGRELPFGPRRRGRHGRGQRRGIEPLQRLHHSGRLRPDPPCCRSRGRTSGATCPSASRRRWCSAPCWPTRCSTRRIRHASAASRGLAMLLLYVLSVWTAARAARREQPAEDTPAARPIAGWLMALMIVGGLVALVFGGEIFLPQRRGHRPQAGRQRVGDRHYARGGRHVAARTGLVGRLGRQGRPDIALGNVVGSNIANILLILGALLHRRPAHAGRHRRRDAGCRRPQFAAPLRSRLHLPPPCARPLGKGVLFLAIYGAYLWWLLAK